MPSVNPGPAVSQSGQTAAVMAPFAPTPANPFPQGAAALRCIAVYKNMPLSNLGDIPINVINSSQWAPVTVAFGNALVNGISGSVAAATLSINSGLGVTGTSIRATNPLTNNTSQTAFNAAAAATVNVGVTAQQIYANVTVAVAGGTVDVYVYGYDLSPFTYP